MGLSVSTSSSLYIVGFVLWNKLPVAAGVMATSSSGTAPSKFPSLSASLKNPSVGLFTSNFHPTTNHCVLEGQGHEETEQFSLETNIKNNKRLGFPGGTMVKNLPANAGDTGLSPGPGRSHMPRSN